MSLIDGIEQNRCLNGCRVIIDQAVFAHWNLGKSCQSTLYYSKCSKISNTKKERTPKVCFLSSPIKQREVTDFAKGGNLIASLCKIGYVPQRIFGILIFKINILLYEYLEHLP